MQLSGEMLYYANQALDRFLLLVLVAIDGEIMCMPGQPLPLW